MGGTVDGKFLSSKNFRQLLKWRKLIEPKCFDVKQLVYVSLRVCVITVLKQRLTQDSIGNALLQTLLK